MRRCPFDGCDIDLPDDRFACRRHWFGLSAEHKARVHNVYRMYQAGTIGVETLRLHQQEVLNEAQGKEAQATDLQKFARLVIQMRKRQQEYFKAPGDKTVLSQARDLERKVDQAARDIINPQGPGLFDHMGGDGEHH